MNILYYLFIGLLAGWLAGLVMKGRSYGLLGNLIIGVIGAVLGGRLFSILGLHGYDFLGSLITAFVGAVVLIYLVRLVKKI